MTSSMRRRIAVLAAWLVGCTGSADDGARPDDAAIPTLVATPSSTPSVSGSGREAACAWVGVVLPSRRLELAAGASGRVVELRDEIGASLAAEDTVAVIDNPALAHGVREAEAALAAAKAGQVRAREDARHAKRRVAGDVRLADAGLLSEDLVQEGRVSSQRSQSELHSAAARVQQLEAERDGALASVAALRVRTPWPARLVRRRAEIGQWVEVGTALLDIASSDDPEVHFAVDARSALMLLPGIAIEVRIAESPRTHLAIVQSRAIDAEPGSRAYRIVARLVTPDDHVLLGAPAWIETSATPAGCASPGVEIDAITARN